MAPAWVAGIYIRECGEKKRGRRERWRKRRGRKEQEEVMPVETLWFPRSVGSRRTDIVWKERRSLRLDDGFGATCAMLKLLLARW